MKKSEVESLLEKSREIVAGENTVAVPSHLIRDLKDIVEKIEKFRAESPKSEEAENSLDEDNSDEHQIGLARKETLASVRIQSLVSIFLLPGGILSCL